MTDNRSSRRNFFKRFLAMAAFGGVSIFSLNRKSSTGKGIFKLTESNAMENPDYAIGRFKNRININYFGLSCFLIAASDGTRIITDPFLPDKKVLHNELKHEPADIVTVSCGHYAHCNVFSTGGTPYVYQITDPTELKGIKFKGIASRHLTMKEVSIQDPGENIIMCFEVDGIKICHLGALGHKLSEDQAKAIGKVDILMAPIGGESTLPLSSVNDVCRQIKPKVILPMHYRSERCNYETWATVDDFVEGKKNVFRNDTNVGSSELEFVIENGNLKLTAPPVELAAEGHIVAPRFVY